MSNYALGKIQKNLAVRKYWSPSLPWSPLFLSRTWGNDACRYMNFNISNECPFW
jgi:hypothetical protein